jgi:hypothetical protein
MASRWLMRFGGVSSSSDKPVTEETNGFLRSGGNYMLTESMLFRDKIATVTRNSREDLHVIRLH